MQHSRSLFLALLVGGAVPTVAPGPEFDMAKFKDTYVRGGEQPHSCFVLTFTHEFDC